MILTTWECNWLVDHGISEDGERIIIDCGALATERADGTGWDCAHGHEHTSEAQYLDADDLGAMKASGTLPPEGARHIDGRIIR